MSPARAAANHTDHPFEHVGLPARRSLGTIAEARAEFREDDRFAREAVEGQTDDQPEVPGATR